MQRKGQQHPGAVTVMLQVLSDTASADNKIIWKVANNQWQRQMAVTVT